MLSHPGIDQQDASKMPIGRLFRLTAAHFIHVALVFWPTLLLADSPQVGWGTLAFACAITSAALLEGHFVRQEFSATAATVHDSLAMRTACFVGLALLLTFWSAQFEVFLFAPVTGASTWIGAAMMSSGIALRVAAVLTLGPRFVTDIRVSGAIVRRGIYRWLRHPSEAGLVLIGLGAPLLIGAPLTAVTAAMVLTPISFWRIRRENAALSLAAFALAKHAD